LSYCHSRAGGNPENGEMRLFTKPSILIIQANGQACAGSNLTGMCRPSLRSEDYPMKGRKKIIWLSVLCFSVTLWVFLYFFFATEKTIVGQVNYFYQIMADGQIYEVANTSMGDDLVMNHLTEKVEVTGSVEETDEVKIITVESFKVVVE
jgi:hypothetical protein